MRGETPITSSEKYPLVEASACSSSPQVLTDADIQMLLTHVQNVVLALRSNPKNLGVEKGQVGRFFLPHPHPKSQGEPNHRESTEDGGGSTGAASFSSPLQLLSKLLSVQHRLSQMVSCCNAVPSTSRSRVTGFLFDHQVDEMGKNEASCVKTDTLSSKISGAIEPLCFAGSFTRWSQRTLQSHQIHELSEYTVLLPLCRVCEEPEVGLSCITVALSSLTTIVTTHTSFITARGLSHVIIAALTAWEHVNKVYKHRFAALSGELYAHADDRTMEVFFTRVAATCVACFEHAEARNLPEELSVHSANALLLISVWPHSSSVLKRTMESALSRVVSLYYKRLGEEIRRRDDSGKRVYLESRTVSQEGIVAPPSLGRDAEPLQDRKGALMMSFIASLIHTDVVNPNDLEMWNESLESQCIHASVKDNKAVQTNSNACSSLPSVGTSSWGVPPNSGLPESTVVVVQFQGLCLAQQAILALSSDPWDESVERHCPLLLLSVQHHLCRALLMSGVQCRHVFTLSLILKTIHLLIQVASEYLVPQIYSFLRVLHLLPLCMASEEKAATRPGGGGAAADGSGSSSTHSPASFYTAAETQERREVLLESLVYLCGLGPFCCFCYTHYDLSTCYPAVLPFLGDVLLYQGQRGLEISSPTSSATVVSGPSPTTNVVTSPSTTTPGKNRGEVSSSHLLALQAAAHLMVTLNEVYQLRETKSRSFSSSFFPVSPPRYNLTSIEMHEVIQTTVKQKNLLVQFAALFAESPMSKGIPFLLEVATRVPRGEEAFWMEQKETWVVLAEPCGGREVGECLFRLSALLDKRALGEYLGEAGDPLTARPEVGEDEKDEEKASALAQWEATREENALRFGTASFFEMQLQGFIHLFDFAGRSLVDSIRELVYRVCLPGEAQKIDRVMEVFGVYWFESNPPAVNPFLNPFPSSSSAFIISFAIILVNTDLHSGKMNETITFPQFHRMCQGAEEGDRIPESYIQALYEDVKAHEIIMAEMVDKAVVNPLTWHLEMRGEARSAAAGPRTPSQGKPSKAVAKHVSPSSCICFWDVLEAQKTREHSQPGSRNSTYCAEGYPVKPWRVVRCFEPAAQRMLSRYVFVAVWKRTLHLFAYIIRLMTELLGGIPVLEKDLCSCVKHVQEIAPLELTALSMALQGYCTLMRTAQELVQEVLDPSFAFLLAVVLDEAPLERGALSKNLPCLLCAREVFALLPTVAPSLSESSWRSFSQLFIRFFVSGVMVEPECPSVDEPETDKGHVEIPPGHSPVPALLVGHPFTFCSAEDTPPRGEKDSGGGWLSNWWSTNQSKRLREATLPPEVLTRLRDAIPSVVPFMDSLLGLPPAPLYQWMESMCHLSTEQFHSPTDALHFSYVFTLLCAVVLHRFTGKHSTEDAAGLLKIVAKPLQELYEMVDKKLPIDARSLCVAVEKSVPSTPTSLDSPVLWLRVLRRVINGLLALLQQTVLHCPGEKKSLEEMEPLIQLLCAVPKRVYSPLVVEPLLSTLESLPSHADESVSGRANPLVFILLYTFHQLGGEAELAVLRRYTTLLYTIASTKHYDLVTQVPDVIEALLSVGLLTQRLAKIKASEKEISKVEEVNPSICIVRALTCCSRTIVEHFSCFSDSDASRKAWCRSWLMCLKALGALAMHQTELIASAQDTPDDPLVCLERSILQGEEPMNQFEVVDTLYTSLLFPLAESFAGVEPHVKACSSEHLYTEVERVIDRSFYNYWADLVDPPLSMTCRLLRFLPQPLLRYVPEASLLQSPTKEGHAPDTADQRGASVEVAELVPKDSLAASGSYLSDRLFDLWKQLLTVLLLLQEGYSVSKRKGSPHAAANADAVKKCVEETLKNVFCFGVPPSVINQEASASHSASLGSARDSSIMEHSFTLLSSRYDFWSITLELMRLFSFSSEFLNYLETTKARSSRGDT